MQHRTRSSWVVQTMAFLVAEMKSLVSSDVWEALRWNMGDFFWFVKPDLVRYW